MLCLMMVSCCCKEPEYECIEMQDVAIIRAGYDSGFGPEDGTGHGSDYVIFDSLAVRKDDVDIRIYYGGNLMYKYPFLIGSQTHKVKFPTRINTQLFLHRTLLQSLDIEMSENSILSFYESNKCDRTFIADSTNLESWRRSNYDSWSDYQMYMERSPFYLDVQRATEAGVFIDSSRSEVACWVMKRMTDNQMKDEYVRCSKWKREDGKEFDIYYNML
jgi:hypothetical protein